MSLVEIKNLNKKYGSKLALSNLSLKLDEGKILGILGPNGSGKTSLLKIMAGLLQEDSGEILIDGMNIGVETKKIVSYLPDRPFLYSWMTIKDAKEFFDDMYEDFKVEKFISLLNFMDLKEDMKVKDLSRGMTEKLNLSLVLSRDARVYILDEPIAGVDPIARDQILDSIINNYKENSLLIITTHLVRDMENIFDDVIFFKNGEIIEAGNADDLREKYNRQIDDIYREIFKN